MKKKEEASVQTKKDNIGRVSSQWLLYQIENWKNYSFHLSQRYKYRVHVTIFGLSINQSINKLNIANIINQINVDLYANYIHPM